MPYLGIAILSHNLSPEEVIRVQLERKGEKGLPKTPTGRRARATTRLQFPVGGHVLPLTGPPLTTMSYVFGGICHRKLRASSPASIVNVLTCQF